MAASKKGLFGNPLIIIGLILLVVVAVFIWKKMKGNKPAISGPTLDTIAANQARAVQQAHAARLSCSSCNGGA